MGEQFPALADSVRALEAWNLAQLKGARVKRSLGAQEFMIGGRWGQRGLFTFPLWRLHGIQDHGYGLGGTDRARAESLLDATGGRELIERPIPVRLARRDFRLIVA